MICKLSWASSIVPKGCPFSDTRVLNNKLYN